MKVVIATIVILLGVYVGAVIGIGAAVSTLPKLTPASDMWVEQSDIDFSDGRQILPNYQIQPAVNVL